MMDKDKPKAWPTLPTDEAAVKFVDEADLSKFDWSKSIPIKIKRREKNREK